MKESKPWGLIPFFIPHLGCPQICIFCNQHRIAQQSVQELGAKTLESVDSLMDRAASIKDTIREYVGTQRDEKYWEVAFYGGSFSAIPRAQQEAFLRPAYEALQEGLIDGIRCSTRPDALSAEDIAFLKSYGVTTVEMGVQSMDDDILAFAKRGHSAQDVVQAVGRLQQAGITVGIQILPGLPGETWQTLVKTAVAVSQLKPDFVRIYPVLVIDNTDLADMYRAGTYQTLSLDTAIQYSAFLKDWMEDHGIQVIRTGLQATEELDQGQGLVAGPYEPAMGELVENERWRQRIEACLEDYGYSWSPSEYGPLSIIDKNTMTAGDRENLAKDGRSHNHKQFLTRFRRAAKDQHHKPIIAITYPVHLASKVKGLKKRNERYFKEAYPGFEWQWKSQGSQVVMHIGKRKFML